MRTDTVLKLAETHVLDTTFTPVLSKKHQAVFNLEVERLTKLLRRAGVQLDSTPPEVDSTPPEIELGEMPTLQETWKRDQEQHSVQMQKKKISGTKRARQAAGDLEVVAVMDPNPIPVEEMAEIVGQRLENRHRPTEWNGEHLDDQNAWKTFYDNFARHLRHKGRAHPKIFIAPRLLRNLEYLLATEKDLAEWDKLSPTDWLEAADTLLIKTYGWEAIAEKLVLETEEMAPLWENFMEKCQSLAHNRSIALKEKKKRIANAIRDGGYEHESLNLRDLVDNPKIEFQEFLQSVATTLNTLATVAKRLKKPRVEVIASMSPATTISTETTSSQIRCHNCNQIGHMVKDCAFPTVCRKCGKPGHIAKDCRAGRISHSNRRIPYKYNNNNHNNNNSYQRDNNYNRPYNNNYSNNNNYRHRPRFNNSNYRPKRAPLRRPALVAFSGDNYRNSNNNNYNNNSNPNNNNYGYSNNNYGNYNGYSNIANNPYNNNYNNNSSNNNNFYTPLTSQ